MENFKGFSEAIQPGSVPEPGREAIGGRFKSAPPKKPTKPAPFVTSEDTGVKSFSDFLEGRCWPGYKPKPGTKPFSPGSCVKESAAAAIAAATAISKKKSGNYDEDGFRKTPYKNPDHPSVKSNTERKKEMNEDLRKWFSKTDPAGDWKRINSKGEAIGPCAREPGEPKPKCMSKEKRNSLTKKERASAVAAKRKHDPNPERKGPPINVSNFGKGKISEDMENLNEKNVPTNPELWSRAKSLARSKFDVYPSAYANGWASKWYKGKGGGWKSVSEDVESLEEGRPSQRHPLEGHEYHKKSDEALVHIAKDAHAAAEAMKSHNTTAENKYRDQANDSATVRHFRKTSGMPDWYKKKYGHIKEEDAYDKDAKPSDKPHDKDAATKRAKIAAVMARKKMAKEEVEQIDELSNDMLGRYKTAAGADASKADKAGDYNKGNKRFSGIMRATKKQMANDIVTRASAVAEAAVVTDKDKIVSVHDKKGSSLRVLASKIGHYRDAGYKAVREAKEKTEYDYEGDMARGQLQSVINNAQRVHDMLEDNDNLPEWVQSKITLAEDYISTVANYMMSEIDEQVEQIDEREDDEYHSAREHKVGVVVSKDNGPKERLKATMRAKEPQQAVNAALKHYKSKGYTVHEHKYLGEALADDKYGSAASETLVTKPYKEPAKKMKESKDNSPPFDGPYTKDKGTVTDKSGAKHTPMSRARDLARKAMKKQADSLKEPSRLGEESSRKAEIVKSAAKKKKPDSKEDTFQAEPELSSTITKNY
jgi:hypothetical protein